MLGRGDPRPVPVGDLHCGRWRRPEARARGQSRVRPGGRQPSRQRDRGGRVDLTEPDAGGIATQWPVHGGPDHGLTDLGRGQPRVARPDQRGHARHERRRGAGPVDRHVTAARRVPHHPHARGGQHHRGVAVGKRRPVAIGPDRGHRDDPGVGRRVGVSGEPSRRRAAVAGRRHHHNPVGDRRPDRGPQLARAGGRPEGHVDHLGAMADRVADAAGQRVLVTLVGVVDGEARFTVVQDDPDRQDPGRRGDPDDAGRPAEAAAVPGDERGDIGAVKVGRQVTRRVDAHGVVRPGADRPGQVRRRRVDPGVQDGDGDPLAPVPAGLPGRGHADLGQLRQRRGPRFSPVVGSGRGGGGG